MNELKWWQKSIVYQIYPKSFQDTTGTGVGRKKRQLLCMSICVVLSNIQQLTSGRTNFH